MPKSVVAKLVHEQQWRWWVGYEGEQTPYLLTAGTDPADNRAMRAKVRELTKAQLRSQNLL